MDEFILGEVGCFNCHKFSYFIIRGCTASLWPCWKYQMTLTEVQIGQRIFMHIKQCIPSIHSICRG